jgi:hypothetical protein
MNSHVAYSALLRSAAEKLGQRSASNELRSLSQLITRIHGRLSQPPRVVLLGEVNAGKSSLANLLIGASVVPTSVVANTRFPLRFHYASRPQLSAVLKTGGKKQVTWSEIGEVSQLPITRLDVGLAVDRLKVFEVIDLPGFGNPTADVTALSDRCSRGHCMIWCTVATQAWKESERRAWIRSSGARQAKNILAVTHMDLLGNDQDRAKVLDRLQSEAGALFGEIVSMDVPHAFEASLITPGKTEHINWSDSGGARLETILSNALSSIAQERVTSAKAALRRAFARRGIAVDEHADQPERAPSFDFDPEVAFIATLLGSEPLLGRNFHALPKP